MRQFFALFAVMLVIAACQPQAEDDPLPTLFPSETATSTATDTPTATHTSTDTATPEATNTPTGTATPSDTPTPTVTFTPSPTSPATVDPTRAARSTATAAVEEAPVFSTFTPVPAGAEEQVRVRPTSTGTPEIVADIVITERQFQEEINRVIDEIDEISVARVDFTVEGILITLDALGDQGAFTRGELLVMIQSEPGFISTQGALMVDEDAPEPSEEFIALVTGEFFLEVVNALDFIIEQRLGETHDLETLTLTDDVIAISLYVPQPE